MTPTAYLARLTRASVLETLQEGYIRTARAKGLTTTTVLYRHAFRNAMFPILSALWPLTAGLITGSFIVEQLFSIPGLGRAFVTSVNARDYGMIMGTTLFLAAVVAVANLAVDLCYGLADPRVRARTTGGSGNLAAAPVQFRPRRSQPDTARRKAA
jgi:oligopeptide transport system permease protein